MQNDAVAAALRKTESLGACHMWAKSTKTADCGYTLASETAVNVVQQSYSATWYCSSELAVDSESGAVALDGDVTSISVSSTTITTAEDLLGKFASKSTGAGSTVYYFPTGQTVTTSGTFSQLKGQIPKGYPDTYVTEYVTSYDENAYPQSDTLEGAIYTYLGTFTEKTLKYETGEYTGTGTYGADSPNSLEFSIAPKCVFIVPNTTSQLGYGAIFVEGAGLRFGGFGTFYSTTGTVSAGSIPMYTLNANKLIWYGTTAVYQQNAANTVYHYLAVG